jgi:beta-glucanase (GH16 family)
MASRTVAGVGLKLVRSWNFRETAPSLYHRQASPAGDFKTNYPFDKDGEDHAYMEQWSTWPDHAGSRSGGNDLQTYSDAAFNGVDPFSQSADGLAITARVNTPTERTPKAFTSGILTTEKSFNPRYGYFELETRLPAGRGMWPHFCLYGQPFTGYRGDEIDIMEHLGNTPKLLRTNTHIPRLDHHGGEAQHTGDWTGRLRKIGLLWTRYALSWFADGKRIRSVENGHDHFQRPMFLTVGLAVGGWDGNETPDPAAFPGAMTVAGLKVYALA